MKTRPSQTVLQRWACSRRGGRAVDGTGLENRHTRKGIGGSNPSLSAITRTLPVVPSPSDPWHTFLSAILLAVSFPNHENHCMNTIDRSRLQALMQREQKKFVDERPKSKALFERARKSLLAGVPMNWMVKWAGAFPPFVREAQGAHFFDVDGHRYTDFCLGDTGAMTGHSPFATVKAAEEQMRRGITLMLPGEDAIIVAEELQKRFNLPLLAIRAHGDRCESLFDSSGAANHGAAEDSGVQLVLSRNGG